MNTDALSRQIALLEAQNRHLRRIAGACFLCALLLAVLALAGWKKGGGEVIRAERFEVVNASGKVVGGLGSTNEGGAKMTLHNAGGTLLASMGETPGGECSFSIFDALGAKRVFAGATAENPRNYLLSVDTGRPGSLAGARSVQIGKFGDDEAGIRIYGSSEKVPRMRIGLLRKEESQIMMLQTDTGSSFWRAFENHSEINFTNAIPEGTDRRLGPSLILNRPQGSVTRMDVSGVTKWPSGP